jgi:hypothetical protein
MEIIDKMIHEQEALEENKHNNPSVEEENLETNLD